MFVPLSVLDFRDRAAAYFGDKIGVIDGEQQFTYRVWAERTHRLANALASLGLEPGDRVSFVTYNTHHLLEAYYGVLEAGLVLNPVNIRLTPREIAYILNHAGSRAVFFHKDFLPLVEALAPQLTTRPQFVIMDGEVAGPATHEYEALIGSSSTEPRHPQVDEQAMAELFYTSGTTGLPKGVALSHRALHLHALNAEISLRFDEDDVILHVVPLFHVNGWGVPHFVTMTGGRHVMLRKFDPVALMAAVQQHRVTRLLAVPAIFNAILHHRERANFDLSSLRQVIIGGSPASPALVKALEEELGCQAIVGYGLSETSPILTLAQPRKVLTEAETPERATARRSMTGWPLPGVTLRVVDVNGTDVRRDAEQIGEIVVRGNTVMNGYYRDPDATAAAIRDGWLHTGDIAHMDSDGYFFISGRKKEMIIVSGYNVYPDEVDAVLVAHPAVLECGTIGLPDATCGESVKSFVVLKPGAGATAEELIAHCRASLAKFKVPRAIEFRAELPRSAALKVLRRVLRDQELAKVGGASAGGGKA